MTDFGRRPGEMLKPVYDTDDSGVVDDSEALEGSTKAEVQDHTPGAHTHEEADITDLDHDALKIQGVDVDATDIADGKVLQYNGTSENLEYETPAVAAAHKTTHQDGGADEISCAGLVGRTNYVNRGDLAAADWTQATLTTDGTFVDLDCSSIVPAGATAIIINVLLIHTAAAVTWRMRKNGNTNDKDETRLTVQVIGIPVQAVEIVPCDAGRVIEYKGSNVTFASIDLSVVGWFV